MGFVVVDLMVVDLWPQYTGTVVCLQKVDVTVIDNIEWAKDECLGNIDLLLESRSIIDM